MEFNRKYLKFRLAKEVTVYIALMNINGKRNGKYGQHHQKNIVGTSKIESYENAYNIGIEKMRNCSGGLGKIYRFWNESQPIRYVLIILGISITIVFWYFQLIAMVVMEKMIIFGICFDAKE
jgi:hypothetical protein